MVRFGTLRMDKVATVKSRLGGQSTRAQAQQASFDARSRLNRVRTGVDARKRLLANRRRRGPTTPIIKDARLRLRNTRALQSRRALPPSAITKTFTNFRVVTQGGSPITKPTPKVST